MMEKVKSFLSKHKEVIIYIVFGAATTLVNFAFFKLFNVLLGESFYLISNAIAWILSVLFAYVTNKLWVFQSKSWKWVVLKHEIPSFFAARVFSFLIEEFGLYVFVVLLNFDKYSFNLFNFLIGGKMIAKIILAVIIVILNYIFSKWFIFKNSYDKKSTD